MDKLTLDMALIYNKDTGVFTWSGNARKDNVGKVAGTIHNGYRYIKVTGVKYAAHRLAWLTVYGVLPRYIDHINHKRDDNRIANLRSVTRIENGRNQSINSNNKSGVMGVHWATRDNRWAAQITVAQKRLFLGNFIEFSDAVNARKNAEVLYGFHANHGKAL